MDCKEFKELISLYLDGKFSEIKELEALENHFASCDSCWEEYAGAYKIHRLIQKRRSEIVSGSPEINKMADTLRNLTKQGLKGDKLVAVFEENINSMVIDFTVLLNGVQQSIKQIRQVLISDLSKAGKLVVKFGEKIIFDENIEESQILVPPDLAPSYRLKEQKPSISRRYSKFVIEVRPGQEGGKLTIKSTDG